MSQFLFATCWERLSGMAPTKKGERKRAKGKGSRGKEGKQQKNSLPDEEKRKHTTLEVDSLKQHLEMIRRYQQLQCQTDARIQHLEAKTQNLQEQLAACQEDVRQSRADRAKTLEEKDEAIVQMQSKIDNMESEYEKILHASLDCVLSKLQTAKLIWEKEATLIHLEYKNQLKEFGLNPLEI
ncbi:dynein regulatory complex protein 12 isoform X3 [Tiliqua scincoides]|uniref:dynein regulatory complex protein 12 isoform X3 n=1 Tax=Tiliqua scincoides TaxID=71010 RepID=UPI0034630A1B